MKLEKIYKGMPDAAQVLDSNFTKLTSLSSGEIIFTGAKYPNAETLVMNVPLSQCENGWILTFTRYDNGEVAGTGPRHFTAMVSKHDFKNQSYIVHIENDLGDNVNKLLTYTDTTIFGHANNGKAPNNLYVLSRVVTF